MQGRSIGSKRIKVGKAAPEPARASIYQEENTPLDWMAPHDLRAQRHATPHARALRHGLIASQLGLPMLARDEQTSALEAWEPSADERAWPRPARAAYSGEAEHAGLGWPSSEQTTRYDEWELQKELVTYERTYPDAEPGYDEHPRLDFHLPPLAAGYEPEHDQRHELDYAQAAYAPAEHREHAGSPGSYPYTQMARDSAQSAAARWHSDQPIRRFQSTNAANSASSTLGTQAHPRAAAPEPRTATQSSFAPHGTQANGNSAHSRAQAHPRAAAPEPRTATQNSFRPAAHTARAQPGATALAPRTTTQTSFARAQVGLARQTRAKLPKQAVRRYGDDEPVVYPRKRSWVQRIVVLLALAGAGYAGHQYYTRRAPIPAPQPQPTAAAPQPTEPPTAPSEPAEATTPNPPPAAPAAPESAKERRLAARAALIAERRERRAARRARDENSASDEAPRRGRAYGGSGQEREPIAERSSYRSAVAPSHDDNAIRSSTSAHDDLVSERHVAAQSGVLRINTLPWSQVHIDGQLVGHTPQMNLLLPAGKHRVTLVNHEMQLSKSLTVQITAGAITTHTINLAD